jgi:hypothetical protein
MQRVAQAIRQVGDLHLPPPLRERHVQFKLFYQPNPWQKLGKRIGCPV